MIMMMMMLCNPMIQITMIIYFHSMTMRRLTLSPISGYLHCVCVSISIPNGFHKVKLDHVFISTDKRENWL